jgi:hypothetical protein
MRTTDRKLGGKSLVGWVRISTLFCSTYMKQCNIFANVNRIRPFVLICYRICYHYSTCKYKSRDELD